MSDKISAFPAIDSSTLTGAALVPVVQDGQTSRTTVSSLQVVLGTGTPPVYEVQSYEVGVLDTAYEVGDLRRYGAVLDLVTDDHTALQNAADSLIGRGGKVIIPSTGASGGLYCATPCVLDTRHQGLTFSGPSFGAGAAPFTVSRVAGDAKIFITKTSGLYAPAAGAPLTGLTFENLGFTSKGATHDHFMVLNGCVKLVMRNVVFSGSTAAKDNIQIDNFIDVTFDNVQHQGAGRYGCNTMTGASTSLRLRGGYWKNCRDAALYAAGNSQLSHVIVDGTLFESNGRDGVGAVITNAIGAGCVFDNVDNLVINAYFEGNHRADCVIGGTISNAGVVTRGLGCRGAWVNGYFQGASGGITATYVGLYLIAVQGITYGGYYSGHQQALVRIDYTRGPGTLDVYDANCAGFNTGSAPAAIIRDDGNRIAVGTNPNGFLLGDVRSVSALIAATLAITSTSAFTGTATFSAATTSALFSTRALFSAAPTFTAVDNLFDRTAAANGATSRTQLHQFGADGVLGPLNLSIQGFPSATAGSRYVEIAVGDSLNNRDLKLTTAGLTVSGKFGCNTKTAQAAVTLPANATDLATAITLVNAIKVALVANGICA